MGRFISNDAYEGTLTNPLSFNGYSYALGNPLKYIDPSGFISVEEANAGISYYKALWWEGRISNDKELMDQAHAAAEAVRDQIGRNTAGVLDAYTTKTKVDEVGSASLRKNDSSDDYVKKVASTLEKQAGKKVAMAFRQEHARFSERTLNFREDVLAVTGGIAAVGAFVGLVVTAPAWITVGAGAIAVGAGIDGIRVTREKWKGGYISKKQRNLDMSVAAPGVLLGIVRLPATMAAKSVGKLISLSAALLSRPYSMALTGYSLAQ